MPKNIVPRDNNERKAIRKVERYINDMNKDVPKDPHQPIREVEKWRVKDNDDKE